MIGLLSITMAPQSGLISSPRGIIGLRSPSSSRRAFVKTKDQLIRAKPKNISFDLENQLCVATRLMFSRNGLTISLIDANTVQSERPTCSVNQPATEVDDDHGTSVYLQKILDEVENLKKCVSILDENSNKNHSDLHTFLKKSIEDLHASNDKVLPQTKTKVRFDEKLDYIRENDEAQISQRRRSARLSTLLVQSPIQVSKGAMNNDIAVHGDNIRNRRRSRQPDLPLNGIKNSPAVPKSKPKSNTSGIIRIDENGNKIVECPRCSKTFPTAKHYAVHFKRNPH